jgi:hypothetical protein
MAVTGIERCFSFITYCPFFAFRDGFTSMADLLANPGLRHTEVVAPLQLFRSSVNKRENPRSNP